jgi:hypothetical protein
VPLPRWIAGEGGVRGLNWSTRCSSSELMGRWLFMGQDHSEAAI